MFRDTYCAARLRTLDKGAGVSPFTAARELGHGGTRRVRQVYGHLGTVPHRANVVQYRVAQHRAKLGDRLEGCALGSVTTHVTTRLELTLDCDREVSAHARCGKLLQDLRACSSGG